MTQKSPNSVLKKRTVARVGHDLGEQDGVDRRDEEEERPDEDAVAPDHGGEILARPQDDVPDLIRRRWEWRAQALREG